LIKNEAFSDPKDLIQKAKHFIIQALEDHNKDIKRTSPAMNNGSFIYLFQKFDEIYQQETFKLKSVLIKKERNSAYESSKEKEAKKTINELLRCEIAISDFLSTSKVYDENPDSLVPLLEVLYEDFDLLPELLLALFLKFSRRLSGEERQQVYMNILNFMIPFLEFLNKHQWDINKIFEKRSYLDHLEGVFKENIEFLKSNVNISEEEIHDFAQRLEQNKSNNEELRKTCWKLCSDKTIYKEETMYYQMLGRASFIMQIKRLDEKKEKLPINFLKMSVISYLCSGK